MFQNVAYLVRAYKIMGIVDGYSKTEAAWLVLLFLREVCVSSRQAAKIHIAYYFGKAGKELGTIRVWRLHDLL